MNREQRRRFNKQNKTNYSREDFQAMELYQALRAGDLDMSSFGPGQLPESFHIDNEELVPEGKEVKLAYDHIMSRPKKGLTEEFLQWVENNKDKVLHVTREEAQNSLVCIKEDVKWIKDHYTDEDTKIGHIPWLFDIWSDLLYETTDHKWVHLGEYENSLKKNTENS